MAARVSASSRQAFEPLVPADGAECAPGQILMIAARNTGFLHVIRSGTCKTVLRRRIVMQFTLLIYESPEFALRKSDGG